jgi:hypothetical protein
VETIEQALLAMLAAASTTHEHEPLGEYCARCVAKRQQIDLSLYLLSGSRSHPGLEWN